jgi:hypothetical protein
MGSSLDTRSSRQRALVVNAATKPVNVLLPAGIAAAGFVLGWPLLLVPIAIVVYVLLAGFTLFDQEEATRVLGARRRASLPPPPPPLSFAGLPPEIAEPLGAAISEERKIEAAIADAKLPYTEVSAEAGVLVEELERVARKGALIHSYITDPEVAAAGKRLETLRARARAGGAAAEAERMAVEALETQMRIRAELEEKFERCCAELEHLAASLGVIRGEIVRMSVAEDASVQDDLADQVRDLRNRVSTVSEGLSEATSRLDQAATG